ncbi:Amidophosphoribosyltransferase protein [Vigna angularis]|uniref:Amidophosphoribosyltransferase protein n=1 Tax=Phaseolus angularis TaxID=3914 RepID=A0A8T0JH63_PHAAN|nr:Amidophosphoribosyltransferase protein [Vigna angularis]
MEQPKLSKLVHGPSERLLNINQKALNAKIQESFPKSSKLLLLSGWESSHRYDYVHIKASRLCPLALHALQQHRGQECASIVAIHDNLLVGINSPLSSKSK